MRPSKGADVQTLAVRSCPKAVTPLPPGAPGGGAQTAWYRGWMTEQPRLLVAAGLVWLGPARVLLQRRPSTAGHGAGRLEFPGGKVERGEAPQAALARELVEEWGPQAAQLRVGPIAQVLHHVYPAPGPEVVLLVYHVDGDRWRAHEGAEATLEPGASVCAFDVGSLPIASFLDADQPFATAIASGRFAMPPSF